MKFDKSKVYTAVNAEELPIESKCIFGDTIGELQIKVQSEFHVYELKSIENEDEVYRFNTAENRYCLAYLVEAPKEKEYGEFSSVEDAMEAIKKHGGWVKSNSNLCFLVSGYDTSGTSDEVVYFCDRWHSLEQLNKEFVFADDGTPCGELVEEYKCVKEQAKKSTQ